MDPCANDYGGAIAEDGGVNVAVSLSAQSPTRVIVELPLPNISLTVSWNFPDWQKNACGVVYKNLWRWQRNWGFAICGFKTIFASDIGAVYQRSGQFTTQLNMPNLTPGQYAITIKVIAVAIYNRTQYTSCLPVTSEQYEDFVYKQASISQQVQYVSGIPVAQFSASVRSGTVPFTVKFTDLSTYLADYPITSWAWDFGDGAKSSDQNPYHDYTTPGTYTVKLTVSNQSGSSSAQMVIQANEGPVHAQFASDCYFPLNVLVAETFTPIIDIQNTGGPGNIYLYYIVKGKQIPIWTSQPIGARSTIRADLGTHNIAYFLQYTPTQDEVTNITFYVGTVGKAYSGIFSKDVGVSVTTPPPAECDLTHPCPSGYQCVNGRCVPAGPSKNVLYALGGVAATGLGLIIYAVFRRRR